MPTEVILLILLVVSGGMAYLYWRVTMAENRAEYYKYTRDEAVELEITPSKFPGLNLADEIAVYAPTKYAALAKADVAERLAINNPAFTIYIDPGIATSKAKTDVSSAEIAMKRAQRKIQSKVDLIRSTAEAQVSAAKKAGENEIAQLRGKGLLAESIGAAVQ